MESKVNVADVFSGIMANTMNHVLEKHGEQAMHHLFFELYDHTFSFLDREFGFEAVQAFWDFIADRQLTVLEDLMKTKGFKGMEEYWRQTLGQEGADYEMEVTEDAFQVIVKRCPPTEWFRARGLEHFPRYCEHCEALYRRVGQRCGFDLAYFAPDPEGKTCCGLRFTRGSGLGSRNSGG